MPTCTYGAECNFRRFWTAECSERFHFRSSHFHCQTKLKLKSGRAQPRRHGSVSEFWHREPLHSCLSHVLKSQQKCYLCHRNFRIALSVRNKSQKYKYVCRRVAFGTGGLGLPKFSHVCLPRRGQCATGGDLGQRQSR